jgi:hypothetical protein
MEWLYFQQLMMMMMMMEDLLLKVLSKLNHSFNTYRSNLYLDRRKIVFIIIILI